MKILSRIERPALYVVALVIAITLGHLLLAPVHIALHSVLERSYYLPILLAAYHYGRKGGILIALLSSIFYLPMILIDWQRHPEYQIDATLELVLFVVAGYLGGWLFEQSANRQRMLQSYEKMAMFGNLSRSIIKSLRIPIKAIRGLLITLKPQTQNDPALKFSVEQIRGEVDTIEALRNDLIALVERKKLILKKHNLNQLMFEFMADIDIELSRKKITTTKMAGAVRVPAFINKKALIETLRSLANMMTNGGGRPGTFRIYTDESEAQVCLGGTLRETRLSLHDPGDLSALESYDHHDYNLVSVINTMNNHFGDAKFRWSDGYLVEFLLVFPKHLKLPGYLRDGVEEPKRHTK